MKNLVILISGRGTNLEAILHRCAEERWEARVAAVFSNRRDAPGLALAAAHGIPAEVLEHHAYPDRQAFDDALRVAIDNFAPDLVILAGFMRVLGTRFVSHYAGRMLNIHPSLLPSFAGLATHRRALEQGVKIHGASVHFVTAELDHGPLVLQAAVPVRAEDDADSLEARVRAAEHQIYPRAVRWFIEDRLSVQAGRVSITPPEPQWYFTGE